MTVCPNSAFYEHNIFFVKYFFSRESVKVQRWMRDENRTKINTARRLSLSRAHAWQAAHAETGGLIALKNAFIGNNEVKWWCLDDE